MPWPIRMFLVWQATEVSHSSGAEEWEYSSRKWCSTVDVWSKPSSSASFTCSRASSYMRRSAAGVSGRGTDSSKNRPNFMESLAIGQEKSRLTESSFKQVDRRKVKRGMTLTVNERSV